MTEESSSAAQGIHDVFVCGAGSTGMYFAYQMSRMGHSIYLCDERAKQGEQEHETTLMTTRTLEILENQGIIHRFMDHCVPSQGIQFHLHGKDVGAIDVVGDMPFPQMRFLMQDQTNDIFGTLLDEQSCAIHWGTKLVEYEQFEDYIEATVRHLDGRASKIRARYIVNADGGQIMAVRRLADVDWPCKRYTTTVLCVMADVVFGGEDLQKLSKGCIHIFVDKKGLCSIIPLKNPEVSDNGTHSKEAIHRIIMNLDPYYEVKRPVRRLQGSTASAQNVRELIPFDVLQSIMSNRIKPLDLTVAELVDISVRNANERKADGFRHNRAFLIGASAYSNSLMNVQAMNTGFQDVDNLAWKLSFVLKGLCPNPEGLLKSYSFEREATAATSLLAIKYLAKLGANHKGTLGTYILETSLLRNRILKSETSTLERKTLRQIINHSVATNPSTATFTSACYTILWVCTRPSNYDACPWTKQFWTKFMAANYAPRAVRPIVIESTWHVQTFTAPSFATEGFYDNGEAFWMEDCWDRYDSISTCAGLHSHMFDKPSPPASMVLVRPDLYVTYSFLIHSSTDIDVALYHLGEYVGVVKAE
ncbi:FAD binding domain-containing protein [Fennellomyces sp. T-0311]|nr:FAD binding domain-containing protein [Fennellomyces sp. T-0311]